MTVALQAATAAGAGIEEAAVRALATVRQVLPARLRHRIDALRFTAIRDAGRPGGSVAPDVLVVLSTAVRAHDILRFDYPTAGPGDADDGPRPPRRTEPHHLVTASGRWYLVA
ncbi:MAG: transcriptional regulator [Cryobacterium sp.]|nr:transcriptional regulator [Cryobacterium sp.]